MTTTIPSTLRGQTVLVTGASGFTGGHLVAALLREGCRVRALVRQTSAVTPLVASQAELVVGDIREAEVVDRAVAGCDQVYHLAALYRDASAPRRAYWDVNVTGTERVLAACAKHRVQRLIHCSTMGVHGHVSTIPSNEASPFNPGDPYQRSKLEAEQRVWAWHRKTQVPTTVLRPLGIYGPGDLRFLKLFRAIQRRYFVMLGSGTIHYHLAYIDDLVDGFLRCGRLKAAVGQAFLIGHERAVTLNELVAVIAGALQVPPPALRMPVWPVYTAGALCEAVCVPLRVRPTLFRRRVDFFTHERAFDISKAKQMLGYAPQVSLADGIRRTVEWYLSQGHLEGRPLATNGGARRS